MACAKVSVTSATTTAAYGPDSFFVSRRTALRRVPRPTTPSTRPETAHGTPISLTSYEVSSAARIRRAMTYVLATCSIAARLSSSSHAVARSAAVRR